MGALGGPRLFRILLAVLLVVIAGCSGKATSGRGRAVASADPARAEKIAALKKIFAPELDPANRVLPPGLPEEAEFPVRAIADVVVAERAWLVLVSYATSGRPRLDPFAQAFSYDVSTKKYRALKPPEMPAGGERLWKARLEERGAGRAKLSFHACTACGDGTRYWLPVRYSPAKREWRFAGPVSAGEDRGERFDAAFGENL